MEALIYSTMASTFEHRPDMTMDGGLAASYLTYGGMDAGDDFVFILSEPVSTRSIKVTKGSNSESLLTNALLETSTDGVTYKTSISFRPDGKAYADHLTGPVKLIRIRLK